MLWSTRGIAQPTYKQTLEAAISELVRRAQQFFGIVIYKEIALTKKAVANDLACAPFEHEAMERDAAYVAHARACMAKADHVSQLDFSTPGDHKKKKNDASALARRLSLDRP